MEMRTIQGGWSDEDNGWVSEVIEMTGDAWLEVELPAKGRVVIKKAENMSGPWPKALITKWDGPLFKIRVVHGADRSHGRFIKVITTDIPKRIEYANI